jgi:hypothetical protein
VIEIVPEERDEMADFQVVNIKSNGEIIKKFSADATSPTLEGMFKGSNAEYLLYRGFMGQGGCARGSLYVIKFHIEHNPPPNKQIYRIAAIEVSPALNPCMGDGIIYSLFYSTKGEFTLTVAGHTMNLDLLDKWVEIKKQVVRKR